ncbi:hypothetical protein RYX36_014818 [Vicia faba]
MEKQCGGCRNDLEHAQNRNRKREVEQMNEKCPKDLPIISRTAGRIAGRAVAYVQLARGQVQSVIQQSQARQLHMELDGLMAQVDAIKHEVRSLTFINPGPLTRSLDSLDHTSILNGRFTLMHYLIETLLIFCMTVLSSVVAYTDYRKPEGAGVNLSISSLTKVYQPNTT